MVSHGGFDVVDFVFFCLAAVLSPPVISRRFGGYRIVPKACNTSDENSPVTGVCMFNNDCAKINGTVAGSCTDGFLFGTCCVLTEGSYYISVPLSLNPTTSSGSGGLVIPETVTAANKINSPANFEDTVLLHHDGSVAHDPYKPVDFIFNKRPELFLTNGSYEDPLGDKYLSNFVPNKPTTESWWSTKGSTNSNKYTTVQNTVYKSSTKYISPSSNYYTPSTESFPHSDYQEVKDVTNEASIFHILNILNDTDPQAPDISTSNEAPFVSSTVTLRPETYTTSALTYLTTRKQPYIPIKPVAKPCKPVVTTYPNKHNVLVLTNNDRNCQPDNQASSNQNVPNAQNNNQHHRPQIIFNTTPQITVEPNKVITHKYSKPHKPHTTVNYNKYTTSKPSNNYFNYLTVATSKPSKYPTHGTYVEHNPLKKNSTQYVHLTGIQVTSDVNVTPKPGSMFEPIPTVILLETPNTTSKPTKTSITIQAPHDAIISVSNGHPSTFRPPSTSFAGTISPIKQGSTAPIYNIPSSPVHNNHVRPVTDKLGSVYSKPKPKPDYSSTITSGPLFEPIGTVITTPTQVLKITPGGINSSEILVAFPPDRDPSANISYLRPDPEIVSWVSTKPEDTIELLEDDSSASIMEDGTFDTKVHSFVENIVQNLQGNFVDLENVLIDGGQSNSTTPTKKPSSKPSKKPSKKPSVSSSANGTKPLITKPPPRPISSTQKPVKVTQTSVSIKPSHKPTKVEISTSAESQSSEVDEYGPEQINKACGIRPLMKNGRIVGGKGATFGEWPWQVLVREATWLGLFTKNKCGGVLLTNRYVITAAHCQPGFLASLIAVFGEFDISGEIESRRSVSRNVRRVIVHRYYNAATFENDVSLLELENPIQFDKHIIPICMPKDDDDFTGKVATVTGWGRLKYGGGVPSVLQEVHVPVIDNNVCQEMFHTAGHSKTILSSFICAGYANGQRDSCEGDSGGPLMVEREDGHWVLAGTVSHGIKCAAPYLPGVYMRTTYYKPWIQTITGVKDI